MIGQSNSCQFNLLIDTLLRKREELVSIVKKLNPENVVLIHGDKEAINWMGASILKLFPKKKVYAVENYREIIFD